ncbi:hypothetical protein [Kribbella deserti]|uniref:Uncharacterized protein n=1 Tax=Kribbella deserti TaxID=1926257 RepID=A0ABV6QDZ5_9ACTN
MGISINVREYTGALVDSWGDDGTVAELCELAAEQPDKYPLLWGVDRYDDTYFNARQAVRMLTELELLSGQPEAVRFRETIVQILRVVSLLEPAPRRPHHRRLHFSGD